MKFRQDNDIKATEELFRRNQLTDVYIFCKRYFFLSPFLIFLIILFLISNPRWIHPSIPNMLRLSAWTRRCLDIYTTVDGLRLDPLVGIHSELEDTRSNDIIKKIIITVIVQTDEDL